MNRRTTAIISSFSLCRYLNKKNHLTYCLAMPWNGSCDYSKSISHILFLIPSCCLNSWILFVPNNHIYIYMCVCVCVLELVDVRKRRKKRWFFRQLSQYYWIISFDLTWFRNKWIDLLIKWYLFDFSSIWKIFSLFTIAIYKSIPHLHTFHSFILMCFLREYLILNNIMNKTRYNRNLISEKIEKPCFIQIMNFPVDSERCWIVYNRFDGNKNDKV